MPNSRSCDEFSERLQIVVFTLGIPELNAVYNAIADVLQKPRVLEVMARGWESLNVQIVLFTLGDPELNAVYNTTEDVLQVPRVLEVMARGWESLNAKAEVARVHRDGHFLVGVPECEGRAGLYASRQTLSRDNGVVKST